MPAIGDDDDTRIVIGDGPPIVPVHRCLGHRRRGMRFDIIVSECFGRYEDGYAEREPDQGHGGAR